MFLERANARDTKCMLCFHATQTGKYLLRTQILLRARATGETFVSATMCPQQCVRNNVSSFARPLSAIKFRFFSRLIKITLLHFKIDTGRVFQIFSSRSRINPETFCAMARPLHTLRLRYTELQSRMGPQLLHRVSAL